MVTMPGRPPLFLRCKKTGHVRGECTTDMWDTSDPGGGGHGLEG